MVWQSTLEANVERDMITGMLLRKGKVLSMQLVNELKIQIGSVSTLLASNEDEKQPPTLAHMFLDAP